MALTKKIRSSFRDFLIHGNFVAARLYLEKHPKLMDGKGGSVIGIAIKHSRNKKTTEIFIKEVLEKYGVNYIPNLQDGSGKTDLMLAAERGYGDTVDVLLKVEGINVNINEGYSYFRGRNNRTAIVLAAENGNKEIVDKLAKHLKVDPKDVEKAVASINKSSNYSGTGLFSSLIVAGLGVYGVVGGTVLSGLLIAVGGPVGLVLGIVGVGAAIIGGFAVAGVGAIGAAIFGAKLISEAVDRHNLKKAKVTIEDVQKKIGSEFDDVKDDTTITIIGEIQKRKSGRKHKVEMVKVNEVKHKMGLPMSIEKKRESVDIENPIMSEKEKKDLRGNDTFGKTNFV